MIPPILAYINAIIFLLISSLHFYWAFGGSWAIQYTMPEEYKESFFNPKNKLKMAISTLIVACGLIAFSWITISNHHDCGIPVSNYWVTILTRVIGTIFIIRAIGDFNHFGLFKNKSDSLFAKKDSRIFVPLCLYLGISSLLITFL